MVMKVFYGSVLNSLRYVAMEDTGIDGYMHGFSDMGFQKVFFKYSVVIF